MLGPSDAGHVEAERVAQDAAFIRWRIKRNGTTPGSSSVGCGEVAALQVVSVLAPLDLVGLVADRQHRVNADRNRAVLTEGRMLPVVVVEKERCSRGRHGVGA